MSNYPLHGPEPKAEAAAARHGRAGVAFAIAALAWAVLMGLLLLVVPFGSTGTATGLPDGTVVEETSRETLVEGEGSGVILLLAVPVVVTGAAVAAWRSRHARDVRFITGAVLLAACMLAAASIGLFYAPAAIGLLIAGASTPRGDPPSARPR